MIKKELLNMHLLPATRKMAETAERDEVKEIYGPWYRNYYGQKTRNTYRCHTYFIYLRAVVEGEVLKVSVFTRERILNGQQSLYDIYINKKEGRYLTFDNKDNKWRTAKIDMLDMGRKDGEMVLCHHCKKGYFESRGDYKTSPGFQCSYCKTRINIS